MLYNNTVFFKKAGKIQMKMKAVSLGTKLRRLRNKADMTQRQLAEKLDVKSSTISDYENDRSVPSTEVLCRYKDVLNADLNWVMGTDTEVNTVLTALNRKDREMIRQFQACSEDEKSVVRQVTKVLYDRHVHYNDPE